MLRAQNLSKGFLKNAFVLEISHCKDFPRTRYFRWVWINWREVDATSSARPGIHSVIQSWPSWRFAKSSSTGWFNVWRQSHGKTWFLDVVPSVTIFFRGGTNITFFFNFFFSNFFFQFFFFNFFLFAWHTFFSVIHISASFHSIDTIDTFFLNRISRGIYLS